MQSDMQQPISDRLLPEAFLAEILQASSFEQLQCHTRNALAALDIDALMLRMNIATSDGTTKCHLFGTLPVPLLKLFGKSAQLENDPVDVHFSKSSLPLAWKTESFCGEDQQAYMQLKEYGVRCGVSVIVRGEQTVSRIDFYARSLRSVPALAKLMADLYLLGLYLHEVVRSLVPAAPVGKLPVLTVREKECLHWSASGKTTPEVGMILGISSHTVSFHLKNVATKLNVYGTRYAITRAVALGITQPNAKAT